MDFSDALDALKYDHYKVARKGWNGKGMWLELVPSIGLYHKEHPVLPWIGLKTADNKFVPWQPSQTDMLAEDWEVI